MPTLDEISKIMMRSHAASRVLILEECARTQNWRGLIDEIRKITTDYEQDVQTLVTKVLDYRDKVGELSNACTSSDGVEGFHRSR